MSGQASYNPHFSPIPTPGSPYPTITPVKMQVVKNQPFYSRVVNIALQAFSQGEVVVFMKHFIGLEDRGPSRKGELG